MPAIGCNKQDAGLYILAEYMKYMEFRDASVAVSEEGEVL